MKKLLVLVLLLSLFGWSAGVERKSRKIHSEGDIYYQHLALSGSFGLGIPLGDFSDSKLGNAEAGGVAGLGAEYYFTESFSSGLNFSSGIFEDDDDPNFTSWVNNYQLFWRFSAPLEGRVRPYAKFGLGFSTITYEEDFSVLGRLVSTSDAGFSLALAGGAIWRVSKLVGISTGVGYDVAFLEDTEVENSGAVVGYDPNYFSINFGVSFFFRP